MIALINDALRGPGRRGRAFIVSRACVGGTFALTGLSDLGWATTRPGVDDGQASMLQSRPSMVTRRPPRRGNQRVRGPVGRRFGPRGAPSRLYSSPREEEGSKNQ